MSKVVLEQTHCPCCGQSLPQIDHYGLRWPHVQRLVIEAVQRAGPHGITQKRLWSAVYGQCDGEPVTENAIRAHLSRINRRLAPLGYTIYAGYTRPAFYRVLKVEVANVFEEV